MSNRWLKDYIRYITRVFLPDGWTKRAQDSRKDPEILPATIWVTLLMGFSLQVPSLEELERRARESFKKLLPRGQRPPSADTIRDSLVGMELACLQGLFVEVMRKARRNKVVSWMGNLRVVAIDGTGLFSSESRCCPDCQVVHHTNGLISYQHKGVFCVSIGDHPKLVWGYTPIKPGEGETTAAGRLVEWLWKSFKHFADCIVLDAGFAGAPFINKVLAKGIHVIVRLKDEKMHIIKDARGLFSHRPPDEQWVEKEGNSTVEIAVWDEEGFTSWEEVNRPLRVVLIKEKWTGYVIRGGKRREETKQREIIVATSLDKKQASEEAVREIIHRRWDIENTGFHELKGNWHLDHSYVHQEVAIQAIIWIMLLAVNLFWLFLYRNRRTFKGSRYSQREIAERLRNELIFVGYTDLARYLWASDTS